jgi:predicted ribosomally synthesized peptide with nif11-like leader
MSVDAAKKFIETAQNSPALQNEVVVLGQNSAAIIELAASKGFDFSADELLEAVKAVGLEDYEAGQELTESELRAVAGGSGSSDSGWTGCACGKKSCHHTDTWTPLGECSI